MKKSLLLVAALITWGCGSAPQVNNLAGGTIPAQVAPSTQAVFARAFASLPMGDALITISDGAGKTLATARTDLSGNCRLPDNLPPQFRATVSLAGTTFRTEVRGNVNMVTLSPLTHLVSLYMEQNPGVELAEAERRVKNHLLLPTAYPLTSLVGEMPFFSPARYLQEADPPALAQQVDSGPPVSFAPRRLQLAESGSNVFKDFGQELGRDYLKSGSTDLIGWVANSLGINFLSPSLRDIGKQLDDIQNQLDDLSRQLAINNAITRYQNDLQTLNNGPVNATNTATNSLILAAQSSNPTNLPVPAGSVLGGAAGNFTANVTSQDWRVQTQTVYDFLLGNTQTNLLQSQAVSLLLPLGFGNTTNYQFTPLRHNQVILDPQQSLVSYYLGVIANALNLLGESGHLAAELANEIRQAQSYWIDRQADSQSVLQQVPDALVSDDIFLDLEYGTMWYLQVHGKNDINTARAQASSYQVGPYDDWHVATQSEMTNLYKRQKAGNSTPLNTLISLGFRGLVPPAQVTDDGHHVLIGDSGFFPQRRSLDTGHTSGADVDAFLVSRTFPGEPERSGLVPPLSCMTCNAMSISSSAIGTQTQLKANASSFLLQAGGNFTVGSESISQTPISLVVSQPADVTQRARWTSSNDAMASVSNQPGQCGLVTWHVPLTNTTLSSVTVTATLHGASAKVTLPPPAGLVATLDSIQLSPYNLQLPLTVTTQQLQFRATAFFLDPLTGDSQAQDATKLNNITFSVLDNTTQAPATSTMVAFNTTAPGLMVIDPSNTIGNITVQATIGNVTGTAPLTIAVPLAP